jgi:hypothetical protein
MYILLLLLIIYIKIALKYGQVGVTYRINYIQGIYIILYINN